MHMADRAETAGIKLPAPDIGEICRYLGYRGTMPAEPVLIRIRSIIRDLEDVSTPGFVMRTFPLSFEEADDTAPDSTPVIRFSGLSIRSCDLYRNLRGCCRVILFAATLGLGPDRLQQRLSLTSMSDAMTAQCSAAAMVEALCNMHNEMLREEAAAEGFLLRPRFSPGYGDLSLTYQKDFINLLDAGRQIGLTLTESLMMVPTKSVTALIGVYRNEDQAADAQPVSGCTACNMRVTGSFRKDENDQ